MQTPRSTDSSGKSNGNIATFDVRNATRTVPTAMNSKGEITGVFYDANGDQHGFVRKK